MTMITVMITVNDDSNFTARKHPTAPSLINSSASDIPHLRAIIKPSNCRWSQICSYSF